MCAFAELVSYTRVEMFPMSRKKEYQHNLQNAGLLERHSHCSPSQWVFVSMVGSFFHLLIKSFSKFLHTLKEDDDCSDCLLTPYNTMAFLQVGNFF